MEFVPTVVPVCRIDSCVGMIVCGLSATIFLAGIFVLGAESDKPTWIFLSLFRYFGS